MTKRIQHELVISENGTLTVPADILIAAGIHAGESITLVQTDVGLLIHPVQLLVPEFAQYMEKLLAQKGLTLSDLLADLDAVGDEIFNEQYGDVAPTQL